MTRRVWLALAAQIHQEIRKLADQAPLRLRFQGGDIGQWQQQFSGKLRELLGRHEPPADWETLEERVVDAPDHQRRELLLHAAGCRDLPVHLLIPRNAGRRPGILALHGHGPFGHDAVAGVAKSPDDYGLQLVRRGYVVAAPCLTPFGRRLDDPKAYRGEDPCAVTFIRLQLLGKVLIAENLRDALWSLAALSRHPRVDPERIGCVGLSYGGRMTMLTTALEPKIRVAVISGALNVMQERVQGRYSCGAQVIPGLLEYGDVPEIASLIAPRPCLWEVGNQDSLMVKDQIGPALERMRRAWSAYGAVDRLQTDFFEGRHQWHGTVAYPLLEKVLQP
ncbi:MAG: acetylxylan esterase [Acidobacteria bacterium]|nr:acetylxylan esterase [Acidobacteriota bacterium]